MAIFTHKSSKSSLETQFVGTRMQISGAFVEVLDTSNAVDVKVTGLVCLAPGDVMYREEDDDDEEIEG